MSVQEVSFNDKVSLVSSWKPLMPIYLFGWVICDYLREIFVCIHIYKINLDLMKEKGVIIQEVDNKYVVVNSKQVTKIVDSVDDALNIVKDWFTPVESSESSD